MGVFPNAIWHRNDGVSQRSRSKSPPGSKSPSRRRESSKEPPLRLNSFDDVVERLEKRVEKNQISGRYHRRPRVLDNDYMVTDKVLGSGLNGDVKLTVRKDGHGHKFAVKAFNFAGVPARQRAQLESEVEVFLCMDHPHIARLIDVYESDEHMDLVMECMEGGELYDRVKELTRFSEEETASTVWQILLALNYIHSHNIMHGDVKLENFMYDTHDSNHIKLIDFGFSKMIGQNSDKACGTLAYIAPEVLDLKFSSCSDQWSLGVIVFALLSGYMPFVGTEREQIQAISKGSYVMKPNKWDAVSEEATDFTRQLLQVDPEFRLTAQAALEHSFIARRNFGRSTVTLPIVKALRDFRKETMFRRCCLTMMAWSLSNEDRAEVEEQFLALDGHHHGAISYEDWRKIMHDQYQIPHAEVKRAFEALAVHEDKEIHYSDFLAAMLSGKKLFNDELLQDTFRRFDADDSGYITVDNMRQVLGNKYNGLSVEALFREVDHFHHGRVSYHEFASYMNGKPLHLHGDEFFEVCHPSYESFRKGGLPRLGVIRHAIEKHLIHHERRVGDVEVPGAHPDPCQPCCAVQ